MDFIIISIIFCLSFQGVLCQNPSITPFTVVNLHEDTQVETWLMKVECADTTNTNTGGLCDTCNIISTRPTNGPFSCWDKDVTSDFNVYYVAGQVNSALSYRNIAKSYFLDIQCVATDGSTATQTLEVDIQPNQVPSITDFPGVALTLDALLVGADATVYSMVVRDNESDPLTYTLYTDPTVDYFQINQVDGTITTAKDLKTAVESSVDIKVNVSDGINTAGPFTVTATIQNLNSRPYYQNLPTNITVYENVAGGTSLIQLSTVIDPDIYVTAPLYPTVTVFPSSDQYKFTFIDGTRTLQLGQPVTGENLFDAETTSYYNISFLLNDGYLDSVEQYINLYVLNVNEPPEFSEPLYYCKLFESETFGSFCDLGLTVTDPEGDSIQSIYLLAGNNSEYFRYDDVRGQFGFNIAYDVDNSGYPTTTFVTIAAVDSRTATGSAVIQVDVLDVNDNTPSFAISDNSYLVSEGDVLGSIGTVTARDEDLTSPNNDVTYTQVGASSGLSQHITVLSTGEVRYINTFDASEHGTSFFALVEAKDGGNPQRSATGTVVVSFVTTTTTTTTTSTTSTSTSTSTTTTTTQAPGYFDDPANVALFTFFMLMLAGLLAAGGYFLYRYCTTGRCCGESRPRKRVDPYDEDDYWNRRDRDSLYSDDTYFYERPTSISSVRLGQNRALPTPKPKFLSY